MSEQPKRVDINVNELMEVSDPVLAICGPKVIVQTVGQNFLPSYPAPIMGHDSIYASIDRPYLGEELCNAAKKRAMSPSYSPLSGNFLDEIDSSGDTCYLSSSGNSFADYASILARPRCEPHGLLQNTAIHEDSHHYMQNCQEVPIKSAIELIEELENSEARGLMPCNICTNTEKRYPGKEALLNHYRQHAGIKAGPYKGPYVDQYMGYVSGKYIPESELEASKNSKSFTKDEIETMILKLTLKKQTIAMTWMKCEVCPKPKILYPNIEALINHYMNHYLFDDDGKTESKSDETEPKPGTSSTANIDKDSAIMLVDSAASGQSAEEEESFEKQVDKLLILLRKRSDILDLIKKDRLELRKSMGME